MGYQVPSAARLRDLFDQAASWRAASAPTRKGRLFGANVALLHPRAADAGETLLHKAIDRLGATAVSIELNEREKAGNASDISLLARVLGRLYDAADCSGVAPSVVQSIAQSAGIPVFFGLDCEQHPVRALGDLWTIEQALEDAEKVRRIRFIGSPGTPPASAFVLAAIRLGFKLEMGEEHAGNLRAPFTVDASDPCQWKLFEGCAPLDPAVRSDNCVSLLQALLVQEIAGS